MAGPVCLDSLSIKPCAGKDRDISPVVAVGFVHCILILELKFHP
jgi:hypothetical protein